MRLNNDMAAAERCMRDADYAAAVQAWRCVLARHGPRAPDGAYTGIARAYRKLGHTQAAFDMLEQAVGADRLSGPLLLEVAQVCLDTSDFARAADCAGQAMELAGEQDETEAASMFLARVRAREGDIPAAREVVKTYIKRFGLPVGSVGDTLAFIDLVEEQSARQRSADGYWEKRKNYVYLHVARQLIETIGRSAEVVADIGSNRTPLLDCFVGAAARYSVDIASPYVAPGVTAVVADFLDWTPPQPIQVGVCMQVLEHVEDPARFAKRLLQLCEVSIVSVPFLEEPGANPGHLHSMIDHAVVRDWFGRDANYHYVAQELSGDRRIICVFDREDDAVYDGMSWESGASLSFRYRWTS